MMGSRFHRPQKPSGPPPRAWKVGEPWPDGYDVVVDGKVVPHVFAYDCDAGMVNAYCLHGHSGYGGQKHQDPMSPKEPCITRHFGRVEVRRKET